MSTKLTQNDSTLVPCARNRDEMKKFDKAGQDCVILDFDPSFHHSFSNNSASNKNADADLLLLAHKGKVACRDFPHPRHNCARFPFETTPQDSHCKHCYCYVCDVPAPCKLWVGNYNHCLAFDNERWNTLRKLSRQAKKSQAICKPHRRHECVKFPLTTTDHRRHCELCFCYVCEVPAPCEKWVGIGLDSHCYAISNNSWAYRRALKRLTRRFQDKQAPQARQEKLRQITIGSPHFN